MGVSFEEKDLGWEKIQKELKKFENGYTKIGFFSNGGDPSSNIAARAAVQEYGAKIKVFGRKESEIPSRPFMRMTFENNKNKISKLMQRLYDGILEGKMTARRALKILGEWYVGQVKMTITTGTFAPLSPLTIKLKKSSKPLINTGEMRNSLQHRESI